MAMDAQSMGQKMVDEMDFSEADDPEKLKKETKEQMVKMAKAIISHIQNNAEVTVSSGIPVATSTSTGQTTGPGSGTIS